MAEPAAAQTALDEVFRTEWPRLIGYVAHIVHDLDAAEEIVQEAMVAALRRWPFDGVPDRPAAWLTTTCRNRALNHLRDTARRRDREQPGVEHLSVADVTGQPRGPLEDDRLRLMFVCCHPALPPAARVALTLRMVAGLATAEIARAFLVSEVAMAQRITRAKRAVTEQELSFEVPDVAELPARLASVIDVVYVIFNEGYLASSGTQLHDVDLGVEAQRLAGLLAKLLPAEPAPHALVALFAFQRSRDATRVDATGELVPLELQDRRRWDGRLIRSARAALDRARATGPRTPLLLQAEIAAVHAGARAWDATDWRRILALYDELGAMTPTPVVKLNRAVALAMVEGLAAALAVLDSLEAELPDHHLFWAARADLLHRSGEHSAAVVAYQRARSLTANTVEQRHLDRRLAECRAAGTATSCCSITPTTRTPEEESHGTR